MTWLTQAVETKASNRAASHCQTIMRAKIARTALKLIRAPLRIVGRFKAWQDRRFAARYALPVITLDEFAPCVHINEPILDDICMPPYFYRDHDDYGALIRIARKLRPKRIVELGTAHGNTVANLCRELPASTIVTVNAPIVSQTGVLTTFKLSEREIGRVYRQHGFASRVTQVFENTLSLDLGQHTSPRSVDLAVIDACHDRSYVVNDFFKCLPYIKTHGVVLFHDTHPSMEDHLAGSYLACAELRRRGYDVRQIEGTWWGIYCASWKVTAGTIAE